MVSQTSRIYHIIALYQYVYIRPDDYDEQRSKDEYDYYQIP